MIKLGLSTDEMYSLADTFQKKIFENENFKKAFQDQVESAVSSTPSEANMSEKEKWILQSTVVMMSALSRDVIPALVAHLIEKNNEVISQQIEDILSKSRDA